MKNPRNVIATVIVLVIAGFWLSSLLASHESRIRGQLEYSRDSFNAIRAASAIEILDPEFRDTTTGLRPDAIRGYLVAAFLQKQNRHDGALRYQARWDDNALEITVAEDKDPPTATAKIPLEFVDTKDDSLVWSIQVDATLSFETGTWLVTSSKFRSVSGKRPF
ncbi:MAG: hypothetical protein AAF517_00150 [Planctomycetota bacterium]